MLTHKILQRQRNRLQIFLIQIKQRPHKVIPGIHKGKNSHCAQNRLCHRNDNTQIDNKVISAVHQSCLIIFLGNSRIKLPDQKNIECASEKAGQCKRDKGIVSADCLPDKKLRNHQNGLRNHHCGKQQGEP